MLERLLTSLATGYILVFYSEHMFWAYVRAGDTLIGYVLAWLMYSLLGFVFLSLIQHFHVRSLWALFICGAVFGWLAEGVIVQTTYESLPMSISFTGLSWHALISVWVGWYAVRQALHTSVGAALRLAVGIGIFYGLWAIWWWTEPGEITATPLEFATFAGITTLLVMLAYWLYDRSAGGFTAGRWTTRLAGGLLLGYFIIVTVPTVPMALVILPLLLGISYAVLRRNKQIEIRESLLAFLGDKPPLHRYVALLALPITATLIYMLAYSQGWQWQTNWVVYLVTMPLGFMLFVVSAVKVWRTKQQSSR